MASNPAPFGTYDILETTKEGKLYQRLEAQDNSYGDDKVSFEGQDETSLLRLHYEGFRFTWGCVSIPNKNAEKLLNELNNTTTETVKVKSKNPIANFFGIEEEQTKYGELKIVDSTCDE